MLRPDAIRATLTAPKFHHVSKLTYGEVADATGNCTTINPHEGRQVPAVLWSILPLARYAMSLRFGALKTTDRLDCAFFAELGAGTRRTE